MAHKTIIKKKVKKEATGIYITVLAVVIILIAGFASYSSINENEELSKKLTETVNSRKQKITDFETIEIKLLLLSRLVGWRDETPWDTNKGTWTNQIKLKETLNYWVNYLSDKYKIATYEPWPEGAPDDDKLSKGKYLTITKLMTELEQIAKNSESKENTFKENRDSKRRRNLDEINEVTRVRENKNNEIQTSRQSVIIIEGRVKNTIDQRENDVRTLAQEINNRTRELETTIKKAELEFTDKTKELTEYADRLNKLRKKLRVIEEGFEVDGEIRLADNINGYVYLDVGRQDAILDGMEFDVFNIHEGNLRMGKGKVKILKIYDTYSEAAIIENANDPQNPIAVGDLVNCKAYSRSKMKSFAFAGKLIGNRDKEELKKKIKEFGGTVLQEIKPELTYLIVGEGYKEDPVFEEARQLGVAIIREKELYSLLGLEW